MCNCDYAVAVLGIHPIHCGMEFFQEVGGKSISVKLHTNRYSVYIITDKRAFPCAETGSGQWLSKKTQQQ